MNLSQTAARTSTNVHVELTAATAYVLTPMEASSVAALQDIDLAAMERLVKILMSAWKMMTARTPTDAQICREVSNVPARMGKF